MRYNDLAFLGDNQKSLKDFDPSYSGSFNNKNEARETLRQDISRLTELQDILYAHDQYSLLIILQAMDAAGKDGIIKHVMSGVNPQGCQVKSFKAPTYDEFEHTYLWRCNKALPDRGNIGIFNRSYYEEVLVTRVHPHLLKRARIPNLPRDPQGYEKLWKMRFEEINDFEKHLINNGTVILKFFLNISKDEQKRRFLQRINNPSKNWKFSSSDINERSYWDDYMKAYEAILNNTSKEWAPWYVIPSNKKWFARTAVCDIITSKLESLDMNYPVVSEKHKELIKKAKEILENEK